MKGQFLLLLLLFFFISKLVAQPSADSAILLHQKIKDSAFQKKDTGEVLFTVRKIYITGNKKTKRFIILRETPFKERYQMPLPVLVQKFEDARRQLRNTALFDDVIVALKRFDGYDVDVDIIVKERWYLFPVPYFKLVDRNINQWLVENKASLKRVNYGIKVLYNNATGKNDKLNIGFINGYTRQASFNYERFYLEPTLRWGGKIGFVMGNNKELNYKTLNDKQVFFRDSLRPVRNFLRVFAEASYRRATKTRHRFGIAYNEEKIGDTILKLNPFYFNTTAKKIRYPEIYYSVTYHDVDFIPYPLRGYEAKMVIAKKGFTKAMNLWELNLLSAAYWKLFSKTYFKIDFSGTLKLPFDQPFYNKRLMGYGDMFIEGYEYYVMDGVAGGNFRSAVSRELLNLKLLLPNIKKRPPIVVPLRIYANVYGNAGYIHNTQSGINTLNDKMLYSGGIGIDIVTFYDVNIKIQWSFNQLGQNGLYLHKNNYYL